MTEPDEDRPQDREPRKLKIDLADLVEAIENGTWETPYFLDLETGKVVFITEDTRNQYDEIVLSLGEVDPAQWTQAFEAALAELDLADWGQESVREADQVENGLDERFIRVPQADSHEGYADMEAFIETVTAKRVAERLRRATHSEGRGAFRRFKDELLDAPDERQRWFTFRDARQRQRALEWLQSEGIEVV